MTQPRFDAPGPIAGANWHPTDDVLARYAAAAADGVIAWSVESHLAACGGCRAAVSAHVDGERLARNRAVLMSLIAVPCGGRLWRLACRCGIPDHLLRLLATTSSLRRSWLLAVLGVLALVTGEAVLAGHLWSGNGHPPGSAWHAGAAELAPFLLIGPLLVLAGVAAAFMPVLDPSYRLAVAAPFSGVTLLLARSASALIAALVPVVCSAFVVPGPGWLPAAVLLPSLAVCVFALAAATMVGPLAAVVAAGVLWVVPLVVAAVFRSPLQIVQGNGQTACAVLLVGAGFVVFLRRDRLEIGWVR